MLYLSHAQGSITFAPLTRLATGRLPLPQYAAFLPTPVVCRLPCKPRQNYAAVLRTSSKHLLNSSFSGQPFDWRVVRAEQWEGIQLVQLGEGGQSWMAGGFLCT